MLSHMRSFNPLRLAFWLLNQQFIHLLNNPPHLHLFLPQLFNILADLLVFAQPLPPQQKIAVDQILPNLPLNSLLLSIVIKNSLNQHLFVWILHDVLAKGTHQIPKYTLSRQQKFLPLERIPYSFQVLLVLVFLSWFFPVLDISLFRLMWLLCFKMDIRTGKNIFIQLFDYRTLNFMLILIQHLFNPILFNGLVRINNLFL